MGLEPTNSCMATGTTRLSLFPKLELRAVYEDLSETSGMGWEESGREEGQVCCISQFGSGAFGATRDRSGRIRKSEGGIERRMRPAGESYTELDCSRHINKVRRYDMIQSLRVPKVHTWTAS